MERESEFKQIREDGKIIYKSGLKDKRNGAGTWSGERVGWVFNENTARNLLKKAQRARAEVYRSLIIIIGNLKKDFVREQT